MKSLSEITADNAAIEKRIEAKRKAALRRLKQRLMRVLYDPLKPARWVRRDVGAAIDAWDAKERRRS